MPWPITTSKHILANVESLDGNKQLQLLPMILRKLKMWVNRESARNLKHLLGHIKVSQGSKNGGPAATAFSSVIVDFGVCPLKLTVLQSQVQETSGKGCAAA